MTEQITNQLMQGGTAVAVIFALTLLFKAFLPYVKKDGNNNFEKRLKKIENEDYHYLRDKLDKLDDRMDKFEIRLTRVEMKNQL